MIVQFRKPMRPFRNVCLSNFLSIVVANGFKAGACPRQALGSFKGYPTMTRINALISSTLLFPYHRLLALLSSRLGKHLATPKPMPKYYHDDPAWSDIDPLPQDDGTLHPLAAIAYTEEYSEAMGYLRAVMAKNEFSERVLGLTEHIISMNPAHYTVW